MRGKLTYSALGVVLCLAPAIVFADWTATGQFNYTDRAYDLTGFTGTLTRPVREADVQVYDINSLAVLASGVTDSSGNFSIPVTDASTRDVAVRVLADTTQTVSLNFSVVDDQNADAVYLYHDAGTDVLTHGSATPVDFGVMTMPASIGLVGSTDWSSQVFNTFDMCLLLADWINNVDGARPSVGFTVGWNPTNGRPGSFYSGGTNRFSLSDDDAYDDPNILHELGHYIEDEFGLSRNTGGSHFIGDDDQDPRLAWSEGFATYVSNSTLDFNGRPRPEIYSDRNSFDDPIFSAGFAYALETAVFGGATNEQAVNAALYDLIDSTATADASPGVDDDPLINQQANVWAVVEEMRARVLPATSMEDFWDIWFDLALGNLANMETVFTAHQIDFLADPWEPNDTSNKPTALTVGTTYIESTFYDEGTVAGGDEDWYSFTAASGSYYLVEVNGAANSIYGRPDPEMFLFDPTLDAVLAYNDDPFDTTLNTQSSSTAQDMDESAPSILWQAPTSGDYFIYMRHASHAPNVGGRYGTYNIRVQSVAAPTPTITQVEAQQMLQNESYQALIVGTNFARGATVSAGDPGFTISNVTWVAPSAIVATLEPSGAVTDGQYSVTVNNPGGGGDTLASAVDVSASARPPIVIAEVELLADAVEVRNLGTVSADLTGWQLSSFRPSTTIHTYTFPSFSLAAGQTVIVYEAPGTDTATDLYDQGAIFNWPWVNGADGDISLIDSSGANVDYIRFISGPANTHQAPLGTGGAWMQPERGSPASNFTLARSESTALYRTPFGLSSAQATMPVGASPRDNAVDPEEDNDALRRAPLFGPDALFSNLEISPRTVGTDDDWFGFLIESGEEATVTATFTHASGNVDLEIYAPGEESTPFLSSVSTTDDETLSITSVMTNAQGSGVYRVRAFGASGATNAYSLDAQGEIPPPVVWVDFAYGGTELGTLAQPYSTLAAAVSAAPAGAIVRMKSGASSETPLITKNLQLEANGGTVRIGDPGARSARSIGRAESGFVSRP